MKGFRDFLLRGNLIELAVAFIMGTAFASVVTTFTKVLLDAIGKVVGGQPNFDQVAIAGVAVGPFITALVNFVIIAAVVYFAIVVPYNRIRDRFVKEEEDTPATTEDLLGEIRDILKQK
ncbi:large conductance mechanosensitive channel protein MscL [Propionicicella superfundia]|uniref:large conductance mechanosensitive channel protein MscL n=1 Tax=Propionicicella superfundia TaxID=348582 RepID=UPI0003F64F42|nr:large conductance mechanosensitive channel protein MscL [Propionicicella superfundia]